MRNAFATANSYRRALPPPGNFVRFIRARFVLLRDARSPVTRSESLMHDFCSDALRSPVEREPTTYLELRESLLAQGACYEALLGAALTWRDYKRSVNIGASIYARVRFTAMRRGIDMGQRVARAPISRRLRFAVLQRDGFRCVYCGRSAVEVTLEVDHVTPVVASGRTEIGNLATACFDCNRGKSGNVLARHPSKLLHGTPFSVWLRAQVLRDDLVGDVADDLMRDGGHCPEPKTYKDFAAYLRSRGACRAALCAGWHAWREYNRGKPTLFIQHQQQAVLINIKETVEDDGLCYTVKRGQWMGGKFYPFEYEDDGTLRR